MSESASSAFSRETSGIMSRAMMKVVREPIARRDRRVIKPFVLRVPEQYNRGWCFRHCPHFKSHMPDCPVHSALGSAANPIVLD